MAGRQTRVGSSGRRGLGRHARASPSIGCTGSFGAHGAASAVGARADDIKPFNPKHVILEVFGPAGTVADINYLDVDAAPQRC